MRDALAEQTARAEEMRLTLDLCDDRVIPG